MAGDRLYSVAVVWFTVQLTGSAAAVALITLADTVPFLVVSLFAGAVADARDGLRLARTVDLIRAGVVAVVPVLYFIGHLHLMGLVIVAAVLSAMEAFFSARVASFFAAAGRASEADTDRGIAGQH